MVYKCRNFKIQELVSKTVYDFYKPRYGEDFMWKFFKREFLEDIDLIRDIWGKAIYINNWLWGGNLQQCGLRTNIDPIVKNKKTPYVSGHCLGMAVDLHDQSGDNAGLYDLVCTMIKEGKTKVLKRVENKKYTLPNNYCHTDGLQTAHNGLEIFDI